LATHEDRSIKLIDTELVVLSGAAKRQDGAAAMLEGKNAKTVQKLTATLIKKGLVREMRAKPGMPIWRSDEEGRALALIILSAPRRASLPPIRAICGSTDCTASGSVRRFQTEAKSPTTFMRYADPIQTRRVSGLTGSTPH
jgi:hypothetical protein